jgi:hypothetical protein
VRFDLVALGYRTFQFRGYPYIIYVAGVLRINTCIGSTTRIQVAMHDDRTVFILGNQRFITATPLTSKIDQYAFVVMITLLKVLPGIIQMPGNTYYYISCDYLFNNGM